MELSVKKSMVEGWESFKEPIKMIQALIESAQHPGLLALCIILATYLLEDAAIVSAALLSADGQINPELAFLALFTGIASGDIGLYWAGRFLTRWRWLLNWVGSLSIDQAGVWLKQKMVMTILLVRIIPGLRLPTYLACGFFKIPFFSFTLLISFASAIWTGLIFYGFYLFGIMFWAELSDWKRLLLPLLIVLIWFGRKKIMARRERLSPPY